MPLAPLTTPAYVQASLTSLSPAEILTLPSKINAVSELYRKHCGRKFTRQPAADGTTGPIEELITPEEYGPVILREYPINDILRVGVNPTVAFTVINNDAATNQQARARIVRSAQAVIDDGPVGGSIVLDRRASGLAITNTVQFGTLPNQTLAALAAAINAVGGGWSAEVFDDFGLWGVSELVAGDGAQGAMGVDAEFTLYAEDADFEIDRHAGLLTIQSGNDDPFTSLRFGPTAGLEFGDAEIRGRDRGVRITYDAGYDPIPDDLQDAVVEGVKLMLERKNVSGVFASEKTDTWSYTARELIDALPRAAAEVLSYYRDHAR